MKPEKDLTWHHFDNNSHNLMELILYPSQFLPLKPSQKITEGFLEFIKLTNRFCFYQKHVAVIHNISVCVCVKF